MTNVALDDLIELAFQAGREIMVQRAAGIVVINKTDGSPVTLADQRAEAIIEAGLLKLAPDIPMIGEEAVSAGRIPDPGPRFFCVDPLDGTRDFVAGGPEFTVNIALIEDGAPTLGVVLLPVTGEVYAGTPGSAVRGVFDMGRGALATPLAPINTAKARPPEGWRVFASKRSGKNSRTTLFTDALGAHTRSFTSSSIKFCRLAEGAADIYPRFGDINEWDAAAGHAVLSAAGGGVMTLAGEPLHYGARTDAFVIHGFVAFGSAAAAAASRVAVKALP